MTARARLQRAALRFAESRLDGRPGDVVALEEAARAFAADRPDFPREPLTPGARIAMVRPCLVPALDELRGVRPAALASLDGADRDEAEAWIATIDATLAMLEALLLTPAERARLVALNRSVADLVATWHGGPARLVSVPHDAGAIAR